MHLSLQKNINDRPRVVVVLNAKMLIGFAFGNGEPTLLVNCLYQAMTVSVAIISTTGTKMMSTKLRKNGNYRLKFESDSSNNSEIRGYSNKLVTFRGSTSVTLFFFKKVILERNIEL